MKCSNRHHKGQSLEETPRLQRIRLLPVSVPVPSPGQPTDLVLALLLKNLFFVEEKASQSRFYPDMSLFQGEHYCFERHFFYCCFLALLICSPRRVMLSTWIHCFSLTPTPCGDFVTTFGSWSTSGCFVLPAWFVQLLSLLLDMLALCAYRPLPVLRNYHSPLQDLSSH